jgi:opacity protein-like surface antigen
MKVFKNSVFQVVIVIAAFVSPAFAQQKATAPFSEAYVSALAGAAVGAQDSAILAVEYGDRVDDHVTAFANLTYFDDLMTDRMRSNLARASAMLAASTGSTWTFQGRDQGLALSVGAKVTGALGSNVRPYVGAGAGVVNLRRKITEPGLGDVTESFIKVFGLSDGNIASTSASVTRPLAEALAGINFVAGRTYVDFAYRYRHAFNLVEPIHFSQLSAGIGVRF